MACSETAMASQSMSCRLSLMLAETVAVLNWVAVVVSSLIISALCQTQINILLTLRLYNGGLINNASSKEKKHELPSRQTSRIRAENYH
jgi:hypothetical protein